MKLTLSFLLYFITIGLHSFSQSSDSIITLQQNVRKLNGIYDSSKKTFFSKKIDSQFNEYLYESEKFIENTGLLKFSFLSKNNPFKNNLELFGITDTLGNIIIPCIYDEIKISTGWSKSKENNKDKIIPIHNFSYFVFTKDDSIGILKSNNKIIYKIPKASDINGKSGINYIFPCLDSVQNHIDFCKVRVNSGFGVYSVKLEKVIVPTEYSEVNIFNDFAICKKDNKYIVFDCLTGKHSEEFTEVLYLKTGSFIIKQKGGNWIVTNNILDPLKNTNKALTLDGTIECFRKHLILISEGKYGIKDENEKTIIPFMYDDIYFLDNELLLVKKDNLWAVVDYSNNLKSEFQFMDIEKQNEINFKNFILFSGIDTSDAALRPFSNYESKYEKNEEDFLHEIQKKTIQLKSELNSHILSQYKISYLEQYVLKSKKGFQLLTILASDSEVKIDSMVWDHIFMIPEIYNYPFEIGVQKGTQFGYYNNQENPKNFLKYDGIYFYYDLYYYDGIMFSGTHNFSSPFAVVKKGNLYHQASYSKTNLLKRITTPSNWPTQYQGKTKWVKYMKEEEYIEKRKTK